ncbi:MAG: hypothetical protein M3Y27_12615 [Acidobacteriota bacterium]|nr:hypothetical protein [Acidobacteriota bacterium]
MRDARLTLGGRFVLAPIFLIRALDAQGKSTLSVDGWISNGVQLAIR